MPWFAAISVSQSPCPAPLRCICDFMYRTTIPGPIPAISTTLILVSVFLPPFLVPPCPSSLLPSFPCSALPSVSPLFRTSFNVEIESVLYPPPPSNPPTSQCSALYLNVDLCLLSSHTPTPDPQALSFFLCVFSLSTFACCLHILRSHHITSYGSPSHCIIAAARTSVCLC